MLTLRARRLALLTVLALGALPACDTGETAPDEPLFSDDIAGRLRARDRYVPLADALALTGLDREIAGQNVTLLAPTRVALRYVGTDFSPVLFSDAERAVLRRVLRHHIVPGRLAPDAFADGAVLRDLDGGELLVRRVGPVVTVEGVTLDVADATEASDGVLYPLADLLLDNVSAPERVRLSPLLAVFRDGLAATGVARPFEALERVTVLAPSNDGFRGLGPGALGLLAAADNRDVYTRALQAHVLPGDVDLEAAVGSTVTTLAGDELAVTRDANRTLFVAGVRVLTGERTDDGRLYVLGEPVLSTLTLGQRLRIRPDLSLYLADLRRLPGALERLNDRDAGSTVFAPENNIYRQRTPLLTQTLAEPAQADVVRRFAGVHLVPRRLGDADFAVGARFEAFDGTVLAGGREDARLVSLENRPLPRPVEQINGRLYTLQNPLLPNTNALDTALLSDSYVRYFRVVQRVGLVAELRARARTILAPPDRPFPPAPSDSPPPVAGLESSPDAREIVLRTASEEFFPILTDLSYPYSFTALNGDTRTLDGSPPNVALELVTVINPTSGDTLSVLPGVLQGRLTQARTGVHHVLTVSDILPPRAGAARAYRRRR